MWSSSITSVFILSNCYYMPWHMPGNFHAQYWMLLSWADIRVFYSFLPPLFHPFKILTTLWLQQPGHPIPLLSPSLCCLSCSTRYTGDYARLRKHFDEYVSTRAQQSKCPAAVQHSTSQCVCAVCLVPSGQVTHLFNANVFSWYKI